MQPAVTSLLIVRRGADVIAQCDAHCYLAKHDTCTCGACSGLNHGAGLQQAIANSRVLAAGWTTYDGTSLELDDSVHHEPLFTLPQETDMLGPVTQADEHRWFLRNLRFLGVLTERHPGLPVIDWTVTKFSVHGRCPAVDGADRRAQFEQWVGALGLDVWPESVSAGGTVHLHALTEQYEDGVTVAVLADIFPEVTEDEADPS